MLNGSETAGEAAIALFERRGDRLWVEAREDATILALSGEPIDEPIAAYGPFVMNTEREIRLALSDYESGRMGRLGPEGATRPDPA